LIRTFATAVLEQSINRYLGLDPQTIERIAALGHKVIKVELTDIHWQFYIFPEKNGLRFQNHYEGEVDSTIKGSMLALSYASIAGADKTSSFVNKVEITGDVELGHTMRQILANVDIDWEEYLSRGVGDVLAHQIGNAARNLKVWGKQASRNLQRNVTEYLQEEIRYLPPREEVEDFFSDVQILRNDVERAEAKLKLLLEKKASP
jgi:ubiquinone biosynthesis accessory factor UbiJ